MSGESPETGVGKITLVVVWVGIDKALPSRILNASRDWSDSSSSDETLTLVYEPCDKPAEVGDPSAREGGETGCVVTRDGLTMLTLP